LAVRICTIGFTKKSAETFFTLLKESGVARLIDVRLNNVSQLAGFAKRDDLEYFLRAICGIDYLHEMLLAPTQDILDEFKKRKGDWDVYERTFLKLMADRRIEDALSPELLNNSCLLCSEDTPEHCHRRLVVEYLSDKWPDVQVEHLV
jgi:uncharacterized protein (DUF488 family)